MSTLRAIGTGLLILAALVLLSIQQPPHAAIPPGCEPDRAQPVVRGLSYAEGFRAASYAQGADAATLAMADRNVEATRALIERCGW